MNNRARKRLEGFPYERVAKVVIPPTIVRDLLRRADGGRMHRIEPPRPAPVAPAPKPEAVKVVEKPLAERIAASFEDAKARLLLKGKEDKGGLNHFFVITDTGRVIENHHDACLYRHRAGGYNYDGKALVHSYHSLHKFANRQYTDPEKRWLEWAVFRSPFRDIFKDVKDVDQMRTDGFAVDVDKCSNSRIVTGLTAMRFVWEFPRQLVLVEELLKVGFTETEAYVWAEFFGFYTKETYTIARNGFGGHHALNNAFTIGSYKLWTSGELLPSDPKDKPASVYGKDYAVNSTAACTFLGFKDKDGLSFGKCLEDLIVANPKLLHKEENQWGDIYCCIKVENFPKLKELFNAKYL